MQKGKRILAMIGIVLLLLLYLSTLVFALLGQSFINWLMASIAATIMIPVLIWAYTFIYGLIKGKNKDEDSLE